MKTLRMHHQRRVRSALAALAVSASAFGSVFLQNVDLRARQDEAQVHAAAGLHVPTDMTQEEIERIHAETAARLGPHLRTVFSSEASAEERKSAISEVRTALAGLPSDSPEGQSMARRINRRVSLIEAGIAATEIKDVTPPTAEQAAAIGAAAAKADQWLRGVTGGSGWKEYLHLQQLGASPDLTVLQQVSHNLTPSDALSEEQRTFLAKPALTELKQTIDTAVAAMNYDGDEAAARAQLTELVDAVVSNLLAWEDKQLAPNAEAVREAYHNLKIRFPAAADQLQAVLMANYFNHNVHITVSERLLSRVVSDFRSETGTIADCIMGAWVTGSQVTDVTVTADVRPSTTAARFELVANGNTRSNTTAQKSPAVVFTQGNHYFRMVHPAAFDGRHVTSGQGTISVDANNTTTGIRTEYDGIPLIGDIVRNIAAKEVAKSRPQSESLTAS
ncbi:MAG: hypothetical protein KDA85_04180, partial [Planctomycetaceae bacterium]|nr:hypothetical protein [Planctomycetaceae bacterium]